MTERRDSQRILLLGNDPADQQWSILDYGDHLRASMAQLVGRDWEVILRAPDTRKAGWWIRRFRAGCALATYQSRYIHYPRLLRGLKADLYHILDHGNSWLIRYLDPKRTVVFCHDLIPLLFRDWGWSLWPWVSGRAFRHAIQWMSRAAAIITNSACTRRDVITHLKYPADRIHVVPLGLDPELHPPPTPAARKEARKAFHLPDGPLLLHVGATAFYKNVEGVLQSLRILLERGEAVRLVRAGEFLRQGQRRLAQKLGVADRVMEMGSLPRAHLRRLYHAADILVYPSWYEGMGIPPLEAMASGVPVIASNRGALPETVGEAGILVDPGAPELWADAIQRVLGDTTLQADLKTLGLARASEFRWEETAEKTWAVYRTILSM